MNIIELNHIDLNSIGLNSKVINGVGEPSVRKVKPYISGHVTDGSSTFTFKVNNTDVTVSVSGGDWKYKPTTAITSLAFVGVPQLESLELNKITGVSTFNLDYPVVPVFKGCDATTENALVYVYHIRGTATDDFDFTLKYIDESDNVTEVTESAVIDGNEMWDIIYKDKSIYSLSQTFKDNGYIKTIEFTERLDSLISLNYSFRASTLQSITFNNETTLPNVTTMNRAFGVCSNLVYVNNTKNFVLSKCTTINRAFDTDRNLESDIDFRSATLVLLTDMEAAFYSCQKVSTIRLDNADFSKVLSGGNYDFQATTSLENIYLKQNSSHAKSLYFGSSPLTYNSMLNIANWLKDLTGGTAQTVTFKADIYNALTAEQQAELEGIIVTQKGWVLATA